MNPARSDFTMSPKLVSTPSAVILPMPTSPCMPAIQR